MTPVDWFLVCVFAVSVLAAFLHGFFVELFSVVGLIAGLVVAGMYYMQFASWLARFIESPPVAAATAFLLIAIGMMVAAGIVGRLLRSVLRNVGLGWADRLAGAAFGAVKGCVLATLLVMAMLAFFPRQPWVKQSQLAPYFVKVAHESVVLVPEELEVKIRRGVQLFHQRQPE